MLHRAPESDQNRGLIGEESQFTTMTDNELVAYWNILQFQTKATLVITDDPDKNERHRRIVSRLLTVRNIPHHVGKLTKLIKAQK